MEFLLENKTDAIIWRGPLKMGAINQFLGDVKWGVLDYLINRSGSWRVPPPTARGILQAFVDARTKTVAKLRGRPFEDLHHTGQHSSFGQLSTIRQTSYLAFREQDHLPEIEALCRQAREL